MYSRFVLTAALLLFAIPANGFLPTSGIFSSATRKGEAEFSHEPLSAQKESGIEETETPKGFQKPKEEAKVTKTTVEAESNGKQEAIESTSTPVLKTEPSLVEVANGNKKQEEEVLKSVTDVVSEKDAEQQTIDEEFMGMAIEVALSGGGERGYDSAFPGPTSGAVLVTKDGRVLGKGRSSYKHDAVQAVIADAGLKATPLKEWCIMQVYSQKFRDDLASSTLYLTLEPSMEAKGEILPPITKLIEQTGIPNVVIGCPSPIPEKAYKGATALHEAGLSVQVLQDTDPLHIECANLIPEFTMLANSKIRRVARKQYSLFQRPLGYLHCSVVDTDNVEAFKRHGNAFGNNFNGKRLNFRDFGAYEIAPPPEVVWAEEFEDEDEFDFEDEPIVPLDFLDEDFQGGIEGNPVTPWYEQADAVVATFPRPGNGPADDNSLGARLNGLKWLAKHGAKLPPGVERILVMDATDLEFLPLTNDSPLASGADVEAFWAAEGRKPTRVLLRRGKSVEARAAAQAAAVAAESAAKAAETAKEAIESGDAAQAAEAALEYQKAGMEQTQSILKQLEAAQLLKSQLMDRGVIVETIEGGEPIDVMKHLGKRSGLKTVVWRAGCWGGRGVKAILAGAFQWVSAHLAVDATGGRFWQKMIAENAVQAACGPERKVKIFADQEDISLEYCDGADGEEDCSFTMDGRPIRHVRLDCRVALVDHKREREFVKPKMKRLDRRFVEEQAPWFL